MQIKRGEVFGRWTIIRETSKAARGGGHLRKRWLCECVCGVRAPIFEDNLRTYSSLRVEGRQRKSNGCPSRACAFEYAVSRERLQRAADDNAAILREMHAAGKVGADVLKDFEAFAPAYVERKAKEAAREGRRRRFELGEVGE